MYAAGLAENATPSASAAAASPAPRSCSPGMDMYNPCDRIRITNTRTHGIHTMASATNTSGHASAWLSIDGWGCLRRAILLCCSICAATPRPRTSSSRQDM